MCPETMEILLSNYQNFFQNVVDCKLENHCRIHNENRVAHLLRNYLNTVRRGEKPAENRVNGFHKLLLRPSCEENNNSDSIMPNTLPPTLNSSILLTQGSTIHAHGKKVRTITDALNIIQKQLSGGTIFHVKNIDTRKKGPHGNDEPILNECLKNKEKISIKAHSSNEHCVIPTERPYRCSFCKMAFKRKMHLSRHFLVAHSKKKSHVCKICGKLFSRKDYLDKHDAGHLKRNFKLQLLKEGLVVRTKMHIRKKKELAHKS